MIKSVFNNIYHLPTLFRSHNELTKKIDSTFVVVCRHIPHYGASELRNKVSKVQVQKTLDHFSNSDQIKNPSEFLQLVQNYLSLLDEKQLCEFLDLPENDEFLKSFATLKAEVTAPLISERHKQLLYDVYREITALFHRMLFVLTSLANVTNGALNSNNDVNPHSYGPLQKPELLSQSHAREILTTLSSVCLLPQILNKFYSHYIYFNPLHLVASKSLPTFYPEMSSGTLRSKKPHSQGTAKKEKTDFSEGRASEYHS